MRAEKLIARAQFVDVPEPKYLDEADHLLERVSTEEQLGDFLFALVSSAHSQGLDTEAAVRKAVLRRIQEVRAHE